MKPKVSQTILTIILIVFTCLFTGYGIYFKFNPIPYRDPKIDVIMPKIPYRPYPDAETADVAETEIRFSDGAESRGELASIRNRFYTTMRATVFTFSGLGNAEELMSVLNALNLSESRATFFITAEELSRYPEQVRMIRNAGHDLGISVMPDSSASVDEIKNEMISVRRHLINDYGITGTIFVRQAYGYPSEKFLEAAGSCGLEVLTEMKEAVPMSIVWMTDVMEMLPYIISENEGKFQRGEIVHFQMNLIQHGDTLLGDMVEELIRSQCVYPVVSAATILEERSKCYTYPLPDEKILPEVLNRIRPGYLEGLSNDEIMERIAESYIGISWMSTIRFLPGFTYHEIQKLNKTGTVKNNQNMVFLTFDDWGTDETVDTLLDVLKRHNVTATFFVKTQYVQYNPNLLRAIAEAGHTIANNTHTHLRLAKEVTSTRYEELTDEEAEELRKDLVTSYQTMQSIVGDMRDAEGRPSLSRLFRPPTLTVSRKGLETVLDCGFTHSISGSFSAQDYQAKDPVKLATRIKRSIRDGAVIILHFSDNAIYTAEALDLCLSELERENKQYRFVGLNAIY